MQVLARNVMLNAVHDCICTYPSNSEIHRNKVEYFKCNFQSHEAVFSKSVPIDEANPAVIVSHKTTEILPKKMKTFEDDNVIKECLLVARNSLCN